MDIAALLNALNLAGIHLERALAEFNETLQSFICLFTLHQGNCGCLPGQPALQDSSLSFSPSSGRLCTPRMPRMNHSAAGDFHVHIHQTSSHFAVQQRVLLSSQEASLCQQFLRHMKVVPRA